MKPSRRNEQIGARLRKDALCDKHHSAQTRVGDWSFVVTTPALFQAMAQKSGDDGEGRETTVCGWYWAFDAVVRSD